jgi:outer membrane protein TolC
VRRDVMAEVQSAYFDLYFLDHALAVVERNTALLVDLSALMSARYAVGGTDQRSVLEVDLERARLQQERATLRAQRTGAEAKINGLLGRQTDTPVPQAQVPGRLQAAALRGTPASRFTAAVLTEAALPNDTTDALFPTVGELQRLAAERSPSIRAHLSRLSAQETAVSLAEAASLPDFTVSVAYSGRAGLADLFDVMVSAPVPIFSGRKQRQAVIEQDALLGESEGEHHAMLSDLDAEIASLHAELLRVRQDLLILADRILPRARASFAAGSSAYRAGTEGLGSLLDAQATLYRHELEYHRLLADFARSSVALERAVGEEVVR